MFVDPLALVVVLLTLIAFTASRQNARRRAARQNDARQFVTGDPHTLDAPRENLQI